MNKKIRFYALAILMFVTFVYLGYSLFPTLLGAIVSAIIATVFIRWMVYPLFDHKDNSDKST
ncbi:hypothetical protein COU18_03410 [Candidatus Kaiserbacteria bacterium CG10_big_fil_rev_8_21_14_0_10_51_14]|uniref:Uncharacterized protein n=1 Tax=Candidatus Kaiserbacteria bacterium CG10_big_fil_rev_8_21_14_0_10_51_14 TaxID=1974610 RepID=A0A2H0UBD3_9BACT|nr:MAG: hypothetical protein COU18_03410 [Candidatus Kaiserbacteria bacterium CG10_big_fil_rev_8_21_14_0_10_51_14]